MAARLFYVRHGETAWALSGRHTGASDIPLTARGEDEARALRPWLEGRTFAAVFTSPRRRAMVTASLTGVAPASIIEPDLAEWDYGAYEGLTSAEICAKRPHWDLYRDGAPDGETPDDASRRADRLIDRLATIAGDVALFGHGHFGRIFAARWLGESVDFGRRLTLSTASLSILGDDPGHAGTRALLLWNATPLRRWE